MSSPYGPDVKASRKEIVDARIPPNFRDNCVDLLLPLNQCRFENFYLPWKCEHERHVYEVGRVPRARRARGCRRVSHFFCAQVCQYKVTGQGC